MRVSIRQTGGVVVAAMVWGGLSAGALAEEAYFSVQGQITTALGTHEMFFGLDRPVGSAENLLFETFTGTGGPNAAGDTIAASGFDSVLTLFNAGGGGIGANNDDGAGGFDSLLSWAGVAPNGGGVIGTDPLPALPGNRLTLNEFGNNGTGPWAVDLVAPADAMVLTFLNPNAANPGGVSQLDSVKFGTRLGSDPGPLGPQPARFNFSSLAGLDIADELEIATTGRGELNLSGGEIRVGGLTTVEAGGTANLTGGVLRADSGLRVVSSSLSPFPGGVVNISGGTLDADGLLSITGDNPGVNTLGGVVNLNGGTIQSDNGTTIDGVSVIRTAGNFNSGSGSTLTIQNGGLFEWRQAGSNFTLSDENVTATSNEAAFKHVDTGTNGVTLIVRNNANLLAENSGDITGQYLFLEDGTATATGVGSTLNFSSGLSPGFVHYLGRTLTSNSVDLNVVNGASATFNSTLFLADGGSTATLDVETGGLLTTDIVTVLKGGAVDSQIRVNTGGMMTVNSDLLVEQGQVSILGNSSNLSVTGSTSLGRSNGSASLLVGTGATADLGDVSLGDDISPDADGSLTVSGGAAVTAGDVMVSTSGSANGSGTLTVAGTGSSLTQNGAATLNLGNAAANNSPGLLTVSSGGTFNSGTGTLTIDPSGTLTLAGGTFNANGDVVLNDGTLQSTTPGLAGFNLASGKSLTANGNSTIAFNNGSYRLDGNTTFNLNDGATMSTASFLVVGGGTNGTLNVGESTTPSVSTGPQPSLTVIGTTDVGFGGGTGIVNVRNFGSANFGTALNLAQGSSLSTNPTVGQVFIGPDSNASVAGAINLASDLTGPGGTAELSVFGDASFTQNSASTNTFGRVAGGSALLRASSGGVIELGPGTTNVLATGRIEIETSGTLFAQGDINLNGGTLERGPNGNFFLAINKTLAVNNAGTATFTGNYNLATDRTLTINAGGTVNATAALTINSGQLNLAGGTLTANTINRTNGGGFNFTDGTLAVDTFNGNLGQFGGTLDLQSASTTVLGNYEIEDGTVAVYSTLGAGPFLTVNGLTTLGPGSTLQVDLDPLMANLGNNDSIILIQSATGISGTFDNEVITSASGLLYEVSYTANAVRLSAITAMLAGDYNGNGTVDAADYTVWADNFGSMVNLAADGNGNGVVDAADYTVWQDNFGNTSNLTASQISAQFALIPEPTSLGLLAAGLGLLAGRRRTR